MTTPAPNDDTIQLQDREKETKRITLWGAFINLFLAVIKVAGGILGQSQALLADGAHSLSDLISDGMVLLAARHAAEDADEDHPYGHGRFETLATVALGILLIGAAVGIAYDAVTRLQSPETLAVPATFTLIIAAISILANEGLYHATRSVARRIRSPMLEANAWHHRSDAISSIVVLIGVGATLIGYPMFDGIAAILVALMIAKIGYELGMQGVQELVDTALEPEMVDEIRETILNISDVRHLHMLRSRRMGHNALIDVHIQVSPKLSVSEGHHISEAVEQAVIDNFDEVNDVTVHIDPEDDEDAPSCKHLPLRDEIVRELKSGWDKHDVFKHIDAVTLHYLDGHVIVEAALPLHQLSSLEQTSALQQAFRESCDTVSCVHECSLSFH